MYKIFLRFFCVVSTSLLCFIPASMAQQPTATQVVATELKLKVGTILPESYRQNIIAYTSVAGLTEPSQYQQWVKVERDYILFNLLTNTIIKIVSDEIKP